MSSGCFIIESVWTEIHEVGDYGTLARVLGAQVDERFGFPLLSSPSR
jgi:hypothetical protein